MQQNRYTHALEKLLAGILTKKSLINLLRKLKFVPNLSDSVNERWIVRVGLDFISQGGDKTVDAARANKAIIAPNHI